MKKLLKFLVPIFLLVIIASCSDNLSDNNVDTDMQINKGSVNKSLYEIGYLDNEGKFVKVSDELLIKFWQSVLKIDPAIPFNDIEVVEVDKDGKLSYFVRTISIDGTIKVATGLSKQSSTRFTLNADTCECKSTKCHSNGCDSSVTDDGACICSACHGGDCSKTSTATSDYSLAFSKLSI